VGIVPIFVLTPLTYLGGVFYSISLLPPVWQLVSQANPILYMVNLFRYGFLGISDINIYFAYMMILAFITVFYALCYKFLESGYGMRS
jgi:ABC-2 type transport system permease protein